MTLGYDRPLYILAFDHRGSFVKKFFGISGQPTSEESARIADAKSVIFDGARAAVEGDGIPRQAAGVLVDEQFGAEIARTARKDGLSLAMPVEKSGQDEFDFDYGDSFGDHIETFDPTFSKVLVRWNPGGDREMNSRQGERLRRLGEWLHANDRKYLFELLVPAEASQMESVGGDTGRYDRELRPELMREAMVEIQAAGIEPDIWKIEGVDTRGDCEMLAAQARSGGRHGVACVVLGRGANDDAVDHWLRMGAGVPGYIGFAIGRSIWWEPLKGYVDGTIDRASAAASIAANYRRFVEVYQQG